MKTNFLSLMLILASCMCSFSCTTIKTLQGQYENNFTIETKKSYDEVWDNVIDFFAQSGMPISTMEKASGLIVSKEILVPQTKEVNGQPENQSAFVVIPNQDIKGLPNAIATFNVRVRDYKDYIRVTVTIYDIQGFYWHNGFYKVKQTIPGMSTGVFERRLAELLTQE